MSRRHLLPMGLTGLRFLLVVPFAWALYHFAMDWALLLLAVAAASDLADGWAARRLGACTALGGYLDATADFALLVAAYAVLVLRGIFPAWLLLLMAIMFAQFLLTSRRGQPLYDPVGKHYGALLYAAIASLLLAPDLLLSYVLVALIVGVTALSLGSRAWLVVGRLDPALDQALFDRHVPNLEIDPPKVKPNAAKGFDQTTISCVYDDGVPLSVSRISKAGANIFKR